MLAISVCIYLFIYLVQNGEITVGWWHQGKQKVTLESMEKMQKWIY